MKKYLLLAIVIVFNFATKAQPVNPPEPCSDLFFSELTFGKVPNSSTWDLNYAVEIFNPTQSTISLSDYSLELANAASTIITIPLSGSIPPGDVYVVCNENADLNLQNLADTLIADLDFGNFVIMDLKNSGTTIDQIGENGTSTTNTFDFNAFLSDPIAYLASIHIDLNDYEYLNIRRSAFVDKGDPSFNSHPDFLNNWRYFLNIDRSNIGTHLSICGIPESTYIGEYFLPGDNLHFPNDGSPLLVKILPVDPVPVSTSLTHSLHSSIGSNFNTTNSPCHSKFLFAPTANTSTCSQMMNVITNCEQVIFQDNNFLGLRIVEIKLTSTNPNITFTYDVMPIGLHGTPTVTSDIISINGLKIYPTITNSIVNIDVKDNYQFTTYNLNGSKISTGSINQYHKSIDFTNYVNGIYLLKLIDKDNKSSSVKIIKE